MLSPATAPNAACAKPPGWFCPKLGRSGWDYVLIGRAKETDQRDFEDLKRDLAYAVKKIHG